MVSLRTTKHHAIKSHPRITAEPIFLLDQCPFRSVDIVGWVSSLSYVPVEKNHNDPALKMLMTCMQCGAILLITMLRLHRF